MTVASELRVTERTVRDLCTVVLLSGRVGRSAFGDGVRRSILDLPVDDSRTILDVWAERLQELAQDLALGELDVRIAVEGDGLPPRLPPATDYPSLRFGVRHDKAAYRGTAGVVKDATRDLDTHALMLVSVASQIQIEPLSMVLAGIGQTREGVSLVSDGMSDVAGTFVLRRARFERVPDIGFVDLKEQAIPASAGSGELRISRRPPGSALPIRTPEEYLAALRALRASEGPGMARSAADDPYAETWAPSFTVVEPGAQVARGAVLQDSVVLAGAVVEEGGIVARSIVCPGGIVRRGSVAVDTVVAG